MAANKTGVRRGALRSFITLASALSISLALGNTAEAYDEPNLNLGFTSFLDGGVPAGPGFYAVEYLQFYTANKLTDQRGNNLGAELGLPKTDIDALVSLSQLIYVSNFKIGSASPGLDVIIPWVASANVSDGVGNTVLRGTTGVGDLLIGPLLQFDPIMGANGPLFVYRLEAQILADRRIRLAVGRAARLQFLVFRSLLCGHVFSHARLDSLSPYSLSVERQERCAKCVASAVHAPRRKPCLEPGRPGFSCELCDRVRRDQGTPDRPQRVLSAANDRHRDQRYPGIWPERASGGSRPGFMCSWGPEQTLFFNAFQEFAAENRPEGERFTLRYVQHF